MTAYATTVTPARSHASQGHDRPAFLTWILASRPLPFLFLRREPLQAIALCTGFSLGLPRLSPTTARGACGALLGAVFLSVAGHLALSLDAMPPGTYRQRGTSSLQRLFRAHFPELVARYESEFAKQLGKFSLERISKAVEQFLPRGDYPLSGSGVPSRRESCRGIARITCTNRECKVEYFPVFSFSVALYG